MSSHGVPGVPLSTCNRSEFYFLEKGQEDGPRLKELLVRHFGIAQEDLHQFLYEHRGYDAIRHLFRVASGLDSMILGEDQIIGQVRQAYQVASEQGAVPGLLARLFQQSSRVGRKVRRDSGIGRHPLSVSRACVDLARLVVGDLTSSCVLVVGAGEAGETAAEALSYAGARSVTVVNRTYSRAAELADRLSGKALSFDNLPQALAGSDIVISCTGSPGFILPANMIGQTMASRPDRPLFLIDIAVPRDIDPEAGQVRNVSLCDIDDLESVSNTGRQQRAQEAAAAEALASEEAWQFEQWRRSLESLPPVIDLRRRAEEVRTTELERTLRKLNGKLTSEERDSLDAMTRAIVNKLLHTPTVYLKDQAPPLGQQTAEEVFGVSPSSDED
jgi:glutamyl-tRNA reductase